MKPFGIFSSCTGSSSQGLLYSLFFSDVLQVGSTMLAELFGSFKTGLDDTDMKSLMHLLITSNFSLAAAVPPRNEAVVNLPWRKFPAVRMETYQVSLSERNPKANHALPVKSQFGLTSFCEYKVIGCAGISCSQESLHFCL